MKKKIVVTGGNGFIGSNFILKNIDKYLIHNIDKETYAGSNNNLEKIKNHYNYSYQKIDICEHIEIFNLFKNFQPNYIVNFAAESHVDRSIDSPLEFVQTNVLGTASLLDASLRFIKSYSGTVRFVHISTDEVYGSLGEDGLFHENTPFNPSSPYSASKACSDHLVNAWIKTYNFPGLITNCSNNYGPYQFPEKLIPLMIANCLDEKKLPIYGKGNNIRDWLYVEDHCEAIKIVMEEGKIGETYNIGGNNEIKNIDIVKSICSILDNLYPRSKGKKYSNLINYVDDRPGHDFRYAIDSSKIKNKLKWTPSETFESGLDKTIHWYLNNKKWWRKIQLKSYNQERLGRKK